MDYNHKYFFYFRYYTRYLFIYLFMRMFSGDGYGGKGENINYRYLIDKIRFRMNGDRTLTAFLFV